MSQDRGFAHILLLILLMAGLAVTVFLVKDEALKIFKSRAAGVNSTDFQVKVGEEEYVLGPSKVFFDNLFSAVPTASGIRAFTAGGVDERGANTYGFSGSDFNNLQPDSNNKGIVLPVGKSGEYDDAGVWLNSVEKIDENHWLGWYHAEQLTHTDTYPYATRWSMALAESFDGGKTWIKRGQVVTADPNDNGNLDQDDTGSGKAIKVGEFFYLFYLSTKDWKTHVARSPVSELGKPGTWQKYYNGSFSEQGLGGLSTPVNGLDGNANFVVYNSYLNRFLAFLPAGKWGFFLYYTQAGNDENTLLNWQKIPQSFYPLVSNYTDARVDHWLQADEIGGLQPLGLWAYGSITSPAGDSSNIGQEFYIYYMRVFPGENIGFDRYLMRRKMTLFKNPQDPYFARVALVRYEKENPHKTMVSTEIAKPTEGYVKKAVLGYLLPYWDRAANSIPLYDCYIPGSWDDHFVSWADPAKYNYRSCESNGDTFVRRIGYISKNANAQANIPVYRCFDEAGPDHFVSTDSNCEGKKAEGLIGFLLSAPAAACGSACTYNETRQDAIDKACNSKGSCSGSWQNPLVVHAGTGTDGSCQWATSTADKCYNPGQGVDCVCSAGSCGAACTYNETNQSAIDKVCNSKGSCSGSWQNPLVVHAGTGTDGSCQWATSTADKCYNPSQGVDCVCK